MGRRIRAIVAGLAALPMTVFAVTSAAAPASAEANGVGLTPALGWSSWSFLRHDPTAANIEAQAKAMKTSGLASVGYQYVNIDDFWYGCPGSQGPDVDQYGRWAINTSSFPAQSTSTGSESGIKAVADYVHKLGLKFGLYVTPGISQQAVAENTPIEGTSYTADQIAEPSVSENNYNCGGMVGIDYSKPGAQQFIDSWADELASWGVDYVKLDGVGSFDIPDVQAWSNGLRQTGRPIHLELSNSLNIADASTWQQYSNGWRTGGDIEDYGGEPSGSSYPLTDWDNVASRFDQVAAWQPYGGPGAFNDYDSIEVGNGSNDGLTYDERQTQLSLWALASSPLILGTDLTHLDRTDLALLKNRSVIAVDQDSIDASRLVDGSTEQVFAKTGKNGDVVAGLFNTGSTPQVITTSAATLKAAAAPDYRVSNLWTSQTTESTGTISAEVPAHGVALVRVTPEKETAAAPPAATLNLTGPASLTGGASATETVTFTDNGVRPAQAVKLGLTVPSGWTAKATSATTFAAVASGATVQSAFTVTPAAPSGLFQASTLTATARYTWAGRTTERLSVPEQVTTSPAVQAPYKTYSSATDAPAAFGQSGQQFGISGAGAGLYSGDDDYSTIYDPGAVGTTATISTEVTAQQNLTGYAKAGLLVRNDMTASGQAPEGATLFESPSGGIQLEWDSNGGTYIDSVTPANGTIPASLPVWLRLVRNGSSYTGYYSLDGGDWLTVGTATVPGQAATQDAGMFVTSGTAGDPGQATFNGFGVTATTDTPALATSYEAEAPANTLAGGAVVQSCSTCSGGAKVGYVGEGGTLAFNAVDAPTVGTYRITLIYATDGARPALISANGGTAQTLSFPSTASFTATGALTVSLALNAGPNTIELSDPTAYAPDFDRLIVAAAPS
ncbi:MAG TPA: NEW3 domain-containing protein [Streptosporangiaceae bacterium]|nr:NEW3 domain-containing protein [Streptosporangiaceae bacterium]